MAKKNDNGNGNDNPLALDPEIQQEKREANEERLQERREQGLVRSFDRTDSNVGWDAQQGALPAQDPEGLYADDPVRFRPDQLPNPEVLRETGHDPVISRAQVAEGDDATLQDGGPQTANVVDEEARELTEIDSDAPRTAEDAAAAAAAAEDEKKSEGSDSKKGEGDKKSSSKKSSKKS